MMVDLSRYKEAFSHLPAEIKEAEINAETHDVLIISLNTSGRIGYQTSVFTDYYLRILAQRNGYAYTQDEQADVNALLKIAYENSLYSNNNEIQSMNRQRMEYHPASKDAIDDSEQLRQIASDIQTQLREKINDVSVQLDLVLRSESYGQSTYNSYGCSVAHRTPLYLLEVQASQDGNFALLDQSKDDPSLFDLDYFAENLKRRLAYQKIKSAHFESGEYPAVFTQDAFYGMMTTLWQEFSGLKYITKSSIYNGQLNQKITSDKLSFTDYVQLDHSGYNMISDSEGSPGKDIVVLEKGVLKGLLNTCTSAERTNMPTSGNCGRRPLLFGNISTDLLVTPKNFCITPGSSNLDELIQHMGSGIVITEYFDIFHTLNIASGDFSVPCYGLKIENGRIIAGYKGLTMSGNLKELFNNVEEVGNDFIIRPMNYLNNYGLGCCSIRFKKLSISGE